MVTPTLRVARAHRAWQHRVRQGVTRLVLVAGVIGGVGGASAQGAWDGLPPAVVATIDRSVASARSGPDVRLAFLRRAQAQAAADGPRPRWEANVGARSDEVVMWLHGRGSLSFDLVDPARPRALAAARSAADSADLEAWLAAHDAALDALSTWLAAWAAHERIALARAAAEAPASTATEAHRRQAWQDRLPAIELEARIWEDRLHASGVPSPIAWPTFGAWRRWASAPWDVGSCTAEPLAVRVARADVRRLRGEAEAASHAAMTPSLQLGVDVSVSAALGASTPLDAGGRLWLRVGAPAAWPTRGSLEVASEGRGARLDLRVASDPDVRPVASQGLAVEAAEARLAKALREARERRALTQASWASEVAGLAAAPPTLSVSGATLAEVDALLDVVASTVTAVHLRAEARAACVDVPSHADRPGVLARP